MAKRQNFVVGSANTNIETQTVAQLNHAWDSTVVLKSKVLNGVFNAVSDYSNDSSNEIANAILKLSGSQPTGSSQTELGDAIDAKINLAAASGTMILDKGVWYAKMQSATVPPAEAEVEGRNYADFSQTDGSNNPIIVVYTYTSGAWVLTETVTPPADYDGYVLVTSKIWDIPEQTGQQGGRVMWNHTAKTFTPYPQMVSFKDIQITGDSTVIMPENPTDNSIVNKRYVESMALWDIFDFKWRDSLPTKPGWKESSSFSWILASEGQAGYDHLVADLTQSSYIRWLRVVGAGVEYIYTRGMNPQVGDMAYNDTDWTSEAGAITQVGLNLQSIVVGGNSYEFADINGSQTDTIEVPAIASIAFTNNGGRHVLNRDSTLDMTYQGTQYYGWRPVESSITGTYLTTSLFPKVGDVCWNYNNGSLYEGFVIQEAIVSTTTTTSITVDYYRAPDGHKICLPDQESALQTLFEGTGIAWYYILDTANQQFKLPRTHFGFVGARDTVGNYVAPGLPNITGTQENVMTQGDTHSGALSRVDTGEGYYTGGGDAALWLRRSRLVFNASNSDPIYGNSATVQAPATQMYLCFFVGL